VCVCQLCSFCRQEPAATAALQEGVCSCCVVHLCLGGSGHDCSAQLVQSRDVQVVGVVVLGVGLFGPAAGLGKVAGTAAAVRDSGFEQLTLALWMDGQRCEEGLFCCEHQPVV
jgi:hypothetical protein